MSFSNYAEAKILDHCLGGAAFTQPAGVYCKLHVGDPGEDGTANAAANTTRKVCSFAAASNFTKSINAQLQWTGVSTNETYTHFSLWDDLVAGNCLFAGDINPDVIVAAAGTFTIASAGLTLTLSGAFSAYLAPLILNHVFGGSTLTQPASANVKLHIGSPGTAGTGNPAAETTRKAVTFAAASSPAGTKASNSQMQWTNLAASETFTDMSIWDNISIGNCLFWGSMAAPVAVSINGTFTVTSGNFVVTLD